MYIISIKTNSVIPHFVYVKDLSLDTLYKEIGCEYIESITLGGYDLGSPIMLIDEDGKLSQHFANSLATLICHRYGCIADDDYIAGNCVIVMFDDCDDWIGWDSPKEALDTITDIWCW